MMLRQIVAQRKKQKDKTIKVCSLNCVNKSFPILQPLHFIDDTVDTQQGFMFTYINTFVRTLMITG